MQKKFSPNFIFPLLFSGLSALVLLSGCAGGEQLPAGLPKLIPVSIQLEQDGAPLVGATVSLIDTAGNQQWYPGGLSNESGTIELYTNGRYKGAPEGKYKVVVTKTETDPSKLGPAPNESDPKYGDWMEKSANEKRDSYALVDPQFSNAKTSTLEVEVQKGMSTPKLDVGKKVKIKL